MLGSLAESCRPEPVVDQAPSPADTEGYDEVPAVVTDAEAADPDLRPVDGDAGAAVGEGAVGDDALMDGELDAEVVPIWRRLVRRLRPAA
jgi:hypothetical protein